MFPQKGLEALAECYDQAAVRHFDVAELLKRHSKLDDAGYHFGICAETSIKHGLREAGLEARWLANNVDLRQTPMRGHWNALARKIIALQSEINQYAQGRRAALLIKHALDPALSTHFNSWSIDIRYADPNHTPVMAADVVSWEAKALDLLCDLAMS
jgi:hypothetical protein